MKIKKGDTVQVTAGKDRGREGKVEVVSTKKQVVVVPGVNMYKRHMKGNPAQGGQKGGIYDVPRPLSMAKVALVCPKCKKVTRVGYKLVGDNKVRICKKCGKEIDTK